MHVTCLFDVPLLPASLPPCLHSPLRLSRIQIVAHAQELTGDLTDWGSAAATPTGEEQVLSYVDENGEVVSACVPLILRCALR